MGGNYLGPKIKTEIDSYISGLTLAQKQNFGDTERTELLKAMFNPVEDWNNGVQTISSSTTIPDGIGHLNVIIPSSVSSDFTIYLPLSNNNIGQEINFINLSAYKITIQRQGSSDLIEGVIYYELFRTEFNYQLKFVSIGSNVWKRINKEDVLIPELYRPSSWVVNGGTALNFSDIDFSAYVPYGVKLLSLQVYYQYSGVSNNAFIYFRPKGSSATSDFQLFRLGIGFGVALVSNNPIIVESNRIGEVQYKLTTSGASTFITIERFII